MARAATTKQAETFSSWDAYVSAFIEPDERQIDVAHRTGIDQTTVSRWLSGDRSRSLTSQSVAKFARAYGRPVLEAFVVAGFLTSEEAGIKFSDLTDLSRVSDRELLAELRRRMTHSHDTTHKSSSKSFPR